MSEPRPEAGGDKRSESQTVALPTLLYLLDLSGRILERGRNVSM